MTESKIKQLLPCKMLIVEGVGFVFNNSQDSTSLTISTITDGIVNANNIISVCNSSYGGQILTGLSTNKGTIIGWMSAKYTGTIYANLIFFYR